MVCVCEFVCMSVYNIKINNDICGNLCQRYIIKIVHIGDSSGQTEKNLPVKNANRNKRQSEFNVRYSFIQPWATSLNS